MSGMPWIKAAKTWRNDPKLVELEAIMGWSKHETRSRWLDFLWWCSEHREDGILRGTTPQQIARAFDTVLGDGEKLVEGAVKAGLLVRDDELRVCDWLDLAGAYLYQKYHTSNPDKLKEIAELHKRDVQQMRRKLPQGYPKDNLVSLSPSGSASDSGVKGKLVRESGVMDQHQHFPTQHHVKRNGEPVSNELD